MEGLLFLFLLGGVGVLVLLIIFIARVNDLGAQVRRLQLEIARLQGRAPTAPVAPSTAPARAATAGPAPPPGHIPRPGAAPAAGPPPLPPAPARPSRGRAEWEALIGEKYLNRIGALALIIGVGFFIKYAFDQNWISPPIRVLIGAALGAGLVAYASRQRERYPIFAQGILGAGISILYLSAYASFNFYDLVPQTAATVMMSVVTALAFERAVRFDSLGPALLGWVGGFLTPALLSGGGGSAAGLFIYLLLLNAALLGLVVFRSRWWVLHPLSLAATYLSYLVWHVTSFSRSDLTAALLFVATVWLLYLGVDLSRVARGTDRPVLDRIVAGANGTFFYAALVALVNPHFPGWTGIATFAAAAVYLLPLVILKRSHAAFTTKAIVLIVIGTGIETSGVSTGAFWAAEALALVLLGSSTRHLRVAALILYPVSFFALIGAEGALAVASPETFFPLANPRALAFLAVALAAGAGALTYERLDLRERRWVQPALHYLWCLVGFILVTVETTDLFRADAPTLGTPFEIQSWAFNRALALAVVWTVYSVLLLGYGRMARVSAATYSGLAFLVPAFLLAAGRGLFFSPVERFTPIVNIRVIALAAVIAGLVSAWATISRGEDSAFRRVVAGFLMGAVATLAFVAVTGETRDTFEKQIQQLAPAPAQAPFGGTIFDEGRVAPPEGALQLENQKQLALSAVWLLYSAVAMAVGIGRRLLAFRIAAMALFGLTILKVFLYDLSFLDALYRTISFMALGVILLAVSFAYQRYRSVLFGAAKSGSGA